MTEETQSEPTWSEWKARDSADKDPYQIWFESNLGEGPKNRFHPNKDREEQDLILAHPLDGFIQDLIEEGFATARDRQQMQLMHQETEENKRADVGEYQRGAINDVGELTRLRPPIPTIADNTLNFDSDVWLPPVDPKDAPDKDAVIVGVIDRGTALGHRAQQFDDGSTRLLAAWQQIADRSTPCVLNDASKELPFGLAFLKPDIDHALQCSRIKKGDLAIDHEAFNRRVGTEDYLNHRGHRELARSAAHGTHILDIATGTSPGEPETETFRKVVRPMVVNLPDRSVVGLSSHNLSYFVILGIYWIVFLADKYWDAAHGEAWAKGQGKPRRQGYPIVINLAFAKQAGSSDGDDPISRAVLNLNTLRANLNLHPVYLVTPTGNDNLERGNANFKLDACEAAKTCSRTIDWRISPGDQSSNYVEIWYEEDQQANRGAPNTPDLLVQVTDPLGRASVLEPKTNHHCWLKTADEGPQAAIFCENKAPDQHHKGPPLGRYLICVAPTELHDGLSSEANSGVWRITVTNRSNTKLFISLNVQTDQSDQPEAKRSRLSYFDDPDYQRFHPLTGEKLDTYSYPLRQPDERRPGEEVRRDHDRYRVGDDKAAKKSPGYTRRHGTMNAIAGYPTVEDPDSYIPGATIAGGYRLSDGKPAPYSSTGLMDKPWGPDVGLAAPIAAFPTDDGVAHLGRLAAGSTDGSVRAMQGTSFACAQMARHVANLLYDNRGDPAYFVRSAIFNEARDQEQNAAHYERSVKHGKLGGGRLDMKPRTKVERLHLER